MIVRIDEAFEKDSDNITDKKILLRLADCIENVKRAKSLREIAGIKKLQGVKNHYRIRIGDYRIGIIEEGGEVFFIRFLNRKDIYRYFPR